MRLTGRPEYTLIAFSSHQASVCRFRRTLRKRFRIVSAASVSVGDREDAASAVRKALKEAGGVQGCLILCGEIPEGGFFRCPAIPVPGVREQRSALEFELPRHLPRVPDAPVIQFFPSGSGENAFWNVYAFPERGFSFVEAILSACGKRADELIHPLLAVGEDDPDIYLPKLETDFVFSRGEWRPAEGSDRTLSGFWTEEFRKLFLLPDGFQPADHAECLLVMRLLLSASFRESEKCVRVLPSRFRPRRLRFHLTITVLLALLLGGIHLKDVCREKIRIAQEYATLQNERDNYKRKNAKLRAEQKKAEKENRDLQKILQLDPGDSRLLLRLADLTAALPSDALVTSLRFNGDSADLVLQSESNLSNLPNMLRSIPYWKVAQLQQRSMGDTITMTMLKLVSTEESK